MSWFQNFIPNFLNFISRDFLLKGLAKKLVPYAAAQMGIESRALKTRYKGITTINDPTINAGISIDNAGNFHIAVNEGFLTYVYLMLYLFCSRIGAEGDKNINPVPPKDLALVVKSIMHAYWVANGRFLYTGGDIDSIRLTDFQRDFLYRLIMQTQRFAIAHELGHVISLDLSRKKDVPERLTCKRKVDEFFSRFLNDETDPRVKKYEVEIKQNWANELEADLIGLQLLLDFEGQESTGRFLACSAVHAWFVLAYTADKYYEKLHDYGTQFSSTHPPSILRLNSLHEEVMRRQDIPVDEAFYEQFLGWSTYIINSLFPNK